LAKAGEPQRRVVVEGCDEKDLSDARHPQDHLAAFGCEMKRGNLYAEQGQIVPPILVLDKTRIRMAHSITSGF